MSSVRLWFKMLTAGTVLCVGGPALVFYVTPSEEEVYKRYPPEVQKRALEIKQRKNEAFDDYMCKLKEYAKSDKSIWVAAAEDEARMRAKAAEEQRRVAAEMQERRNEIKKHSIGGQ